jgi:monofunctional biosynthetic peptidoglycan transglycosylase
VRKRSRRKQRAGLGFFIGRVAAIIMMVLVSYYGFCTLLLLSYNFISPPVTGVQIQRTIEGTLSGDPLVFSYQPVPRDQISQHLAHAVIAAEDGRFFEHFGVDWKAVEKAMEDNRRRGTMWRGGSTITQQLVKNLFMTTHSSLVRKAFEVPLTFLAELLLPKERILTLYLNVIEWSSGVYGAEAAARHYFGAPASGLSRYQAASLAAVIPAPRSRSPQRMGSYTSTIQRRMAQMGY